MKKSTQGKPIIKWSGSKRSQAAQIIAQFPSFQTYFEPFVGGGSMLYAASPAVGIAGDICEPLIQLWNIIKNDPQRLLNSYEINWSSLQEKGYLYYYTVRDRFNQEPNGLDLFFLSRTCVNGLIRFNKAGLFNNSLHHTRKGIQPESLRSIISDWAIRLKNTQFIHADYRESTRAATENDFIYLDPPYFHTKGRYYGTINFDEFLQYLQNLNQRGVKFALSFDGTRGMKEYSTAIPSSLYRRKILLFSGNSTFRKVMDNSIEGVHEALYLNYD